VVVLMVRRIDQIHEQGKNSQTLFWPVVPAICLALLAAQGDFALANSARQAAAQISSRYNQEIGKEWFQGHWGFQYYMELEGGVASDYYSLNLVQGDRLVIPENTCYIFPLPETVSKHVIDIAQFPLKTFASTMNREIGAGFYSHLWGPLPFVVGRAPAERYGVLGIDG